MSLQNRGALLILLMAGCLYAAAWPRTFVGYYYDDAQYILTAQSLLQGRYVALNSPGTPALNGHYPGLAFLLAPFVKALHPRWDLLKMLPWLLTLLNLYLFWGFMQDRLRFPFRLMALALFAWHPVTLQMSQSVMSEPLFITLFLASLLSFQRLDQIPVLRQTACAALWMALASITRPEGIVIPFLASLLLMCKQRWKDALVLGGLSFLPWIGMLLWNHAHTGNPTMYLGYFMESLPTSLAVLGEQIYLTLLCVGYGYLSCMTQPTGGLLPVALLVTLFFLGEIGTGGSLWIRKKPMDLALLLAVGTTLTLLAVHMLWRSLDFRYFYIPSVFLLMGLSRGLQETEERFPKSRLWIGLLFVSLGLQYLSKDIRFIRQGDGHLHSPLRKPAETFDWIRRSTPSDSYFLAENAYPLSLYTERFADNPKSSLNALKRPEEFWAYLRGGHVTHLYYARLQGLINAPPGIRETLSQWQTTRLWVQQDPKHFHKVYENPAEETEIYAL